MEHICSESETLLLKPSLKPVRLVRKGRYYRRSDGQWIKRYQCLGCKRTFSTSFRTSRYRQKKRHLNHSVKLLLNSGVSQRRAARILGINRKTVVRKFRFMAAEARLRQRKFLSDLPRHSISFVQFDDLETSEHSKCKPLSVALAVEPKSRKILGFQVSQMPAKGRLAHLSRRKYGPRKDERPLGWNKLFQSLQKIVAPDAHWLSDENPHYPKYLQHFHPRARHECVKGRRGCIAGQGELKKIGYDPLFSLNHTCAMLRANLNRLFRRTWCTTKTRQGLLDHLALYVDYHNHQLTPKMHI